MEDIGSTSNCVTEDYYSISESWSVDTNFTSECWSEDTNFTFEFWTKDTNSISECLTEEISFTSECWPQEALLKKQSFQGSLKILSWNNWLMVIYLSLAVPINKQYHPSYKLAKGSSVVQMLSLSPKIKIQTNAYHKAWNNVTYISIEVHRKTYITLMATCIKTMS